MKKLNYSTYPRIFSNKIPVTIKSNFKLTNNESSEIHHMINSLRLKKGDCIEV